ncbi:MAG: TfoX/Sxy family protein [Chloroflexota bacterium]
MKEEPEYLRYIIDRLSPLGETSSKFMFGGWGIFYEGLMFAVFASESLYFKVDDSNREMYEKAGSTPFPHGISYWEVPAEVIEDEKKLCDWAQISMDIARRKAEKKKKK